ncbi:unnamed protein product [Leuciscus chuanchicus]
MDDSDNEHDYTEIMGNDAEDSELVTGGEETFPNKQEELLQEKRLRWSLRKNPAKREMKIQRNKQVRWNKVKWRRNARSFRNLNKTLKEEERNVLSSALSVEGASQLNQA